ncbi:MAG: hypothetical protein P8X57_10090 [Cyclobacteriaceae bacterium]
MPIKNPLYIFILVLISVIIPQHNLQAQYTSVNGNFEVDEIRGCPGLTVNITNNSGIDCGTVGCDFDYKGDGYNLPPEEDIKPDPFTFTYEEAGTYDLYILFGTIEDYITITVVDKPQPEFEIITCAGNGVTVNVTDNNYEEYLIDFGDGSQQIIPAGSPEVNHTYPNSTTRTISVQGLDNGWANNCNPATRIFTPVPVLPAASIDALNITSDREITLDLGTASDVRYRLYISTNGGSYNILSRFSDGRTTEVIDLPFLANNYYCFRLDAVDPCGGPALSSDEVCSIRLNASVQNNANDITWQTNDPTADFELYRDGMLIATLPPGTRSYTDTNIVCGTDYCYTLTAGFGAALSTSRELCITSNNSLPPPAVEELTTLPEGNSVTLSWVYDDPSSSINFDIFRSESGLNPVRIGSSDVNTFVDNAAINPGFTTYCYEIVPYDACDNRNFGNAVACVMGLDGVISLRDEVELNWPQYTGYTSGVAEYVIEKSIDGINFTDQGQTLDTVYTETDGQDGQLVFYRIRAVPNDVNADPSFSYVIRLIKSNQLFFPEYPRLPAFAP